MKRNQKTILGIVFSLILVTGIFAEISTFILPGNEINPDDPDIPIKNDVYDANGTAWGWRYDAIGLNEPRHRDLGQSFTTHDDFVLDKIILEIENEMVPPQARYDAVENAPFHMEFYTFDNVGDIWPSDTLWSQSGILPTEIDSAYIAGTYYDSEVLFVTLAFDIEDYSLHADQVYGFLLKFDELRENQDFPFNKTHSDDYYPEGALYFIPFGGTRENMTMEDPQHPGENPRRDLNFWIVKSDNEPTNVTKTKKMKPSFSLEQNYPNPFNPSTKIKYYLSQPESVQLTVYNSMGQQVYRFDNISNTQGWHEVSWSGIDQKGNRVDSGVYFYQLETESSMIVKKMILMQ